MTCIVGLEHDGKVYIGGDRAGVSGWTMTVVENPKVFIAGPCIIGFTQSFRLGQLLQYGAGLGALMGVPSPDSGMLMGYVATTFVDAVRACLKAGGMAKKENEVEAGGQFLVGIRGQLFRIDPDYGVTRAMAGYMAVGCGDDVALGSMHSTGHLGPEYRITEALTAAESWNIGVRGPFTVLSK